MSFRYLNDVFIGEPRFLDVSTATEDFNYFNERHASKIDEIEDEGERLLQQLNESKEKFENLVKKAKGLGESFEGPKEIEVEEEAEPEPSSASPTGMDMFIGVLFGLLLVFIGHYVFPNGQSTS
ncbi:hypothetical protein QR680_018150 [Steinernema hermaphroditum]|uniref:Uncharacterized protein n=1 Tax=Steinernema hermaphroditum TaxID=289476 RepID=A0AA39LQC7_9BILA|nr:hypothetical protein QR680_018150 [Steinernema hermaphroditum]